MGTDSTFKKTNKRIRKFFSRIFSRKRKHRNYEELQSNQKDHLCPTKSDNNDTLNRLKGEDVILTSDVVTINPNDSVVQGNATAHEVPAGPNRQPNINSEVAQLATEKSRLDGDAKQSPAEFTEEELKRLFPLSYDRDKQTDDTGEVKARKKRKKKKKKRKHKRKDEQSVSELEPLPEEVFEIRKGPTYAPIIGHNSNISEISDNQQEKTTETVFIAIQDTQRKERASEYEHKGGQGSSELDNESIKLPEEFPDLIQFEDVEIQGNVKIAGSALSAEENCWGPICPEMQLEAPSYQMKVKTDYQVFHDVFIETVEIHATPPGIEAKDKVKDCDVVEFFGADSDEKSTRTTDIYPKNDTKEPDITRKLTKEYQTRQAIHFLQRNDEDLSQFEDRITKNDDIVGIDGQKEHVKQRNKKKRKKNKLKLQVDKDNLRVDVLRYEQIRSENNVRGETIENYEAPKEVEGTKKKKWKKGFKKARKSTWKIMKSSWKYLKTGMTNYANSPVQPPSVASLAASYDRTGRTTYSRW